MWPFKKAALSHIATKSASFLMMMGAGRGALTGATFDQLAREGYNENAVVNACVNKIANSVASIDRKLYKKAKGNKFSLVETHPLLDLLAKPNPFQSGDEFMRELVAYRQIGGNAYVRGAGINYNSMKSKPPTELMLLNPGKVKINPSKTYFPASFEYKPTQDQVFEFPVNQLNGMSEILHLKTFNPLNPWYGLPPMLAAAYGIDINNSGQKWNKRLLDNDARPSGALTVQGSDGKPGGVLGDDQYRRVQEMLDNSWSGSENAGRPLLLEGGLEWKPMSMSAKDMDFHEAKNSSATDIGLVFGVPPQLLGIPGSTTFANYEQAMLSFWLETVLPLNDLVLDAFNRWLVPLYGDDLVLKYDPDTVDALEPIRKQKSDRIKEANYMTIDEKRKALGHDSLPNKNIGSSLLLDGRGILIDMNERIISLGATQTDPTVEPGGSVVPPPPKAPQAKFQAWLESEKYTKERAEKLTKLIYG